MSHGSPYGSPYPIVIWSRMTEIGVRYRIVQVSGAIEGAHPFTLEIGSLDAMGDVSWRAIPFAEHALTVLAQTYQELRALAEKYL